MPEQQENQTEVFHLKAPFKPTGDQPQAIEALVQGLKAGDKGQTLLGVTGSGKTFTMRIKAKSLVTSSVFTVSLPSAYSYGAGA